MRGSATRIASAPGKLVLMGEYAVLCGHEAVVAAVDVRARARIDEGPLRVDFDDGGLLRACLGEVEALGRAPTGHLVVDTSAFVDERARKLGLGSSAAACVAALRALLPDVDAQVLHACAQRAHRRFQRGTGSGVDVAASCLGGLVRFRRCSDTDEDVRAVSAPPLPAGLALLPVWSGRAQDTRDFLRAILALADVASAVLPMAEATERFVLACESGRAQGVVRAVDDARAAMSALGARAGIDIVSAPHARIAEIAAAFGGAAKPSGAGGGDIALVFCPAERAAACATALAEEGLPPLPLRAGVDVVGARCEALDPDKENP